MQKLLSYYSCCRIWFLQKRALTLLALLVILLVSGYALFMGQGTASAKSSNISTVEIKPTQDLKPDAIPNGLPIAGNVKVSSSYGKRIDPFTHQPGFHAGIDFSAKPGTPILATAEGKVKRTGFDWKGSGLFIEIEHPSGYSSLYAHLDKLHYVAGEQIAKNQILGEVGTSGRSTGPHLHYEISYRGSPINPVHFLSNQQPITKLASSQTQGLKKILVIRNDGYSYREISVR